MSMAQGNQEFALVGYSEDLERRPLKFVEPIPAARVCSACGNVPRSTFSLLCGHILCEPCYEASATISECVCPLEGDVCVADDVTYKKYPAGNLLRRKVHCWNEANGCSVVLPASQVTEHVRHHCQHHVTRCPTCLAVVLCRDMCAHLRSRCTALALHAAPEPQQGTDNNEKALLVAFEKKVEQRVGELDARLAQLSLESGTQNDKLIQLCHNINHLNEALQEKFGPASVKTLDRLDRNVAEMKALYSEKSEGLMTAITSVLAYVESCAKSHHWVLTGYAAHKEEALEKGWSWSMKEEVYLRRYLISWGMYFKRDGGSVYLALCFQLHKGRNDRFIEWPFANELELIIIHPETRQERRLHCVTNVSGVHKKLCSRPGEVSNQAITFTQTMLVSNDIEHNGYVKRDELLLKFQVLL